VVLPWTYIQVEAACLQIAAFAIVKGIAEQIREPPLSAVEVGEWKPDVTLTLLSGVIHGDDQPLAVGLLPGAGDEIVG